MKVGGNMTMPCGQISNFIYPVWQPHGHETHGDLQVVSMRVPGGSGGIARREHALIICSSPSTSSLSMGFKAEWKAEMYFFAST